jgi:hypothetical protein
MSKNLSKNYRFREFIRLSTCRFIGSLKLALRASLEKRSAHPRRLYGVKITRIQEIENLAYGHH